MWRTETRLDGQLPLYVPSTVWVRQAMAAAVQTHRCPSTTQSHVGDAIPHHQSFALQLPATRNTRRTVPNNVPDRTTVLHTIDRQTRYTPPCRGQPAVEGLGYGWAE